MFLFCISDCTGFGLYIGQICCHFKEDDVTSETSHPKVGFVIIIRILMTGSPTSLSNGHATTIPLLRHHKPCACHSGAALD